MKKRILSLLCVFCLMLTMLPTSAFAAGYDAPTLSIEASYDSASNKVTAKVILGACSDLGGLDFHMKYDLDKLAVESIVGNEEFGSEDYTTISDNTATTKDIGLSFVKTSGMTVTGTKLVFTATFSVKPGQTGDAQFSFDDYYTNFAHKNGDDTASTPATGSVTTTTVTIPKAPISSVSATVNQPVKGQPLDTVVSVPSAARYTAEVMWKADGVTVSGNALADTVYTAFITLKAKEGETFARTLNKIQTSSGYTIQMLNSTTLQLTKEFDSTGSKTMTGINIIDNIDGHALTVNVPHAAPNTTKTNTLTLAAMGVYDDGSTAPVNVAWSIVTNPKPEGVDIGADGKLTVTNKAEDGTIQVKAELNGKTDTEFVTIKKDAPVESAIVLTAPSPATVAVPKSDTPNEIDLPAAAVYDQYGMPMTATSTITYGFYGTTPTGVTLAPGSGKIKVNQTAQAGEVKIVGKLGTTLTSDPVTYNITRETSHVTSVRVNAPTYLMEVPKVPKPGTPKQASQQFEAAKVLDQYGQEMPGETVTWNVADDAGNSVTGVSIDNNGLLTVTNEAPAITVYVTATCSSIVSNKSQVTISKEPLKDSFVKICDQAGGDPETNLSIPPAAIYTNSEAYTAKVYDQYGKETGGMVFWELDKTYTGVELDTTTSSGNAILNVDSTATPGTIKLIATCSTHGSTASQTLDIALNNKTPATVTTAPTAKTDLKYNGGEQALLTAGVTNDGTMQYSLGASSWSTTIPTAKDAATYTVQYMVKGDETHADSTPVTLTVTIGPKVLTKDDLTPTGSTSRVYNGTTNSSITVGVKEGVLCGSDILTITGSAVYNSADVAEANQITFTPTAITTGNYTLAASEELTITNASITPRDLTVTPDAGQSKPFGGADPTLTYTYSGEVSGEAPAFDGALIRETGEDAGSYKILQGNLALKDNGAFKAANYTLKWNGTTPAVTFAINKIAPTNPTGLTGVKGQALSTVSLPTGWTWDAPDTVMTASGNQTFAATFSGDTNHNAVSAHPITVYVLNKTDVSTQITFSDGTLTYNGNAQTYEKATISGVSGGTWTYTYTAAGTGTLDSAGLPLTAGTYTVTAKYEDDDNIGTKSATLTISKATPIGTPNYTKITTSGKTLANANLTVGTITPAGTISWNAGNAQIVAANTAYDWTFRPTDTVNYNNLTGSITPYVVSYFGDGFYTPSYSITVDKTENGTITVSPQSASKGSIVTITVKPDKGYTLETLYALDMSGYALKLTEKNGKYTFTMPTGKVTVKGSFVEEAPVQIFVDVPVDAYYYEAVNWAVAKKITEGIGNGLFAPNDPCARAQIVTFLWRAAGSPAPKNMSSFADVPADAFYAKAVAWAVENGITGGTGDGKFSPDATCTRAQSVTFLYRAAGSPKVSSSAEFGDVATNAYYADAVAWAAKNGITGGIGGGLFGSDNNCTRAQIVTFLYRSVK